MRPLNKSYANGHWIVLCSDQFRFIFQFGDKAMQAAGVIKLRMLHRPYWNCFKFKKNTVGRLPYLFMAMIIEEKIGTKLIQCFSSVWSTVWNIWLISNPFLIVRDKVWKKVNVKTKSVEYCYPETRDTWIKMIQKQS